MRTLAQNNTVLGTGQFNTTNSTGPLTLNVLLSVAQFEREVTAERIRDKVAASQKKGMWLGGVVPLGYAQTLRSAVVSAAQSGAYTTRDIADYLNAAGISSRQGRKWYLANVVRALKRLGVSTPRSPSRPSQTD